MQRLSEQVVPAGKQGEGLAWKGWLSYTSCHIRLSTLESASGAPSRAVRRGPRRADPDPGKANGPCRSPVLHVALVRYS